MKFTLRFGKNLAEVDNKFGDESFSTDLIGCGPITILALGIFAFTLFKTQMEGRQLLIVAAMSLTFGVFGLFTLYQSLKNKLKLNKKTIEIIFDENKLKDGDNIYQISDKEIDYIQIVKSSGKYSVFEYMNVGFYINEATLYYNFDLDSFEEFKDFIKTYTDYKLINIK